MVVIVKVSKTSRSRSASERRPDPEIQTLGRLLWVCIPTRSWSVPGGFLECSWSVPVHPCCFLTPTPGKWGKQVDQFRRIRTFAPHHLGNSISGPCFYLTRVRLQSLVKPGDVNTESRALSRPYSYSPCPMVNFSILSSSSLLRHSHAFSHKVRIQSSQSTDIRSPA